MADHVYGFRYLIEPWAKPRPEGGTRVMAGVVKSDDNHGYADEVLVASILKGEDGKFSSIALFDSISGPLPSREVLLLVRDQINHHLEHHTQENTLRSGQEVPGHG